jgi:hypothetical protein
LTVVSIGLIVVFAFGLSGMTGCWGDNEVKVKVVSEGTRCTIEDKNGSNRIVVEPGDWVVFENGTASDVKLTFSPNLKLFGALDLMSYAGGSSIKLMVLNDAEDGEHPIRTDCGTTDPPPVIIINPPGGGDDNP